MDSDASSSFVDFKNLPEDFFDDNFYRRTECSLEEVAQRDSLIGLLSLDNSMMRYEARE